MQRGRKFEVKRSAQTYPQLLLYSNLPWFSCMARSGVWKLSATIWQPAFQKICTHINSTYNIRYQVTSENALLLMFNLNLKTTTVVTECVIIGWFGMAWRAECGCSLCLLSKMQNSPGPALHSFTHLFIPSPTLSHTLIHLDKC